MKRFINMTLVFAVLGVFMSGIILFSPLVSSAEEIAGTIVIGDDEELTGAYAATTYCHAQAAQDYWKDRNYRIKVDGKTYKIKHLFVDNKSDVSLAVSNFHRFAAEKAVIIRSNWTPGVTAMEPLAKKNKIPVICCTGNGDSLFPPSKYIYTINPTYEGMLCAGVKWYKENVYKGSGKMKLGMVLWDTSMGRAVHKDEIYKYFTDDLGIEVLPTQFFPYRVKNFTAELLKLKNQKADLIYFHALAGQYAMLAKDASRLGVKANLMSCIWVLGDKYLELAGDAAEGTYGMWQWYVDPKDDNPSNPEVQKVHDLMEKYRGNRYYDVNYFHGYECHYVIEHILKKAIRKYGYPITSDQVAEVTANLENWDWGLSKNFAGYASGDRHGWHEMRLYQVQKGKVACVTDWLPTPPKYLKRAPWIEGKTK